MSASQFASFAAYKPPPDEQPSSSQPGHKPSSSVNPWFNNSTETSYQSGGIPAFNTSLSGGITVDVNSHPDAADEAPSTQWETRFGWRVDVLSATAYLFGPISALVLLIFETHNDYVRFHAYQSALLSIPLIFIRIVLSLLTFPAWTQSAFTYVALAVVLFMAYTAYRAASRGELTHFRAPFVGEIAEKWLADE